VIPDRRPLHAKQALPTPPEPHPLSLLIYRAALDNAPKQTDYILLELGRQSSEKDKQWCQYLHQQTAAGWINVEQGECRKQSGQNLSPLGCLCCWLTKWYVKVSAMSKP
jgi:hypothetical protein